MQVSDLLMQVSELMFTPDSDCFMQVSAGILPLWYVLHNVNKVCCTLLKLTYN